jgi:hypothetical protein
MVFERVFWSFESCIEGFKYCRPFISVYDTHMYERYDRKLSIVVVFDGNNGLFPSAFIIINEENIF